MKIVTLFVRLRDHLGKNASILKDIEVVKDGEEEKESEEAKVVEVTESEAKAIEVGETGETGETGSEPEMQEETKSGDEEPLLFESLQEHIRNMTKYIFYEGKEGGEDDLFGDGD